MAKPEGSEGKHPGGRPTEYDPDYARQAAKLCEFGATDEELADFFEVNVRTIYRWQAVHEEFCQALKIGKFAADDRVERALFHKATGYKHEAVKIFLDRDSGAPVYAPYVEYVPPDTTACIFWLKNRRRREWQEKLPEIQPEQSQALTSAQQIKRALDDIEATVPVDTTASDVASTPDKPTE